MFVCALMKTSWDNVMLQVWIFLQYYMCHSRKFEKILFHFTQKI